MKVQVVSAFVPLTVKHLSMDQYHEYGTRLTKACGGRLRTFTHGLEKCWAYGLHEMPPATETPGDRYATPRDHVASHIVQHNRTAWAMRALLENPEADVVVWLDYAILKQGAWNGKQLTEDHVHQFLDKLESWKELHVIPFPGMEEMKPILPHGNNWRFCGSTHIWPRQFLPEIHAEYQRQLCAFVHKYKCVPLDLAIWPLVEFNSGLPFRFYKAEYDRTQLTELTT